jgi:hypothetical protein
MEREAFITTNSGGDLVIVSGRERFVLSRETTRDFLCPESSHVLCGQSAEYNATISFVAGENLVLFLLHHRLFFARWAEFLEVIGGDVQWMPLSPATRWWVP